MKKNPFFPIWRQGQAQAGLEHVASFSYLTLLKAWTIIWLGKLILSSAPHWNVQLLLWYILTPSCGEWPSYFQWCFAVPKEHPALSLPLSETWTNILSQNGYKEFSFSFLFGERVSLCSTDHPETPSVDQDSLKRSACLYLLKAGIKEIPCLTRNFLFKLLGIKFMTWYMPGKCSNTKLYP